jgi:non-specific serine/threonine protein kinase
MTPERWRQIKDVLHGALDLSPEQRTEFLDRACPTDHALRKEVESLLSSPDEELSSFLKSTEIRITLGQGTKLGEYEVQSLLGAGGMGEVYRARDLRLNRDVAIKVLPRYLSADSDRLRRFEQEARAAAALNHPNILAIFQLGTCDGAPYLVSELLEGTTLRQEVRDKPLTLPRIVDFGVQVAEGLAAAHEKGILHRDLKPENLFIAKHDRIKILDFGLAKLTDAAVSATAETRTFDQETKAGVLLGTLGYMSPEQARGEALDAGTDLFSFGAVLYEMTTGLPAFHGPTAAVIFNSILTAKPAALSQLRNDAPLELERIIYKALEKDRQLRYRSAAEMKADLVQLQHQLESGERAGTAPTKRLRNLRVAWIGSTLALAMFAGGIAWFRSSEKERSVQSLSHRETIAVLPFQNIAGDGDLEYLSTALPDEVISTLSYAPTLNIRPFSMSQQFTGEKSDPHQAGQQLRVGQVITGRFRRHDDRVGLTLEATDVANDEIVWHGSVDVTSKDLLTLRQELTTALQKGLLPALGVSNVELSRTKPKSQEAYELYLRSQNGPYWTVAGNNEAIAMLEKSVALDPGYAPAWLALGLHYATDSDFGGGGDEMYQKTVAALQRAHQLDSDLLAASTMLIERRAFYEDLTSSFAQIQELARKRPRTAWVHAVFSEVLRAAGALKQAARECEIVRQLDPEFYTGGCVVLHVHMGDFVKAREGINRTPGDFNTMMLGQILLREGRVEEALPKLKTIPGGMQRELLRDCWPDSSTEKCATTARQSEASFRRITFTDAWYFGAALQAFLNKKDGAIRLLQAATDHNLCVYPVVDSDPLFDKIRDSAEFKAVRQAGIECQRKFSPYAEIEIQ